ncbi:MAG TPA: NUDIX hydrolase [Candidatus Lokiarchaeia archaeon]|nr:NUDIX hydrolase [Candidatus Lokiarchaeia archaeon]
MQFFILELYYAFMPVPQTYRIAADALIVDNPEKPSKIVLITRKNPPYQGDYALPGGFLEPDETVETCCIREAKEETSLDVERISIVGVYSDPNRDPRGRTVSVTYLCNTVGGSVEGSDDASSAQWVSLDDVKDMTLAFDHAQMLHDAGLL